MKYRLKQQTAKVKGQKRRVADRTEQPDYSDAELAKLVNYDYGCLLDMIYYKLENMRDFFMSKHTHCADAKKREANGGSHAAYQYRPRQGCFFQRR